MGVPGLEIRRATLGDAEAATRVRNEVVAERRHSAMDEPGTTEGEAAYLASFGPRAAMFLAVVDGRVEGLQTIEPFCDFLRSMRHVGVLGTHVTAAHRGRGIGHALWTETCRFARDVGYEKVLIYVRAGNASALRFYRGLGFRDVGVARRQVRIDGVYEDEVFLEAFLDGAT